MNEKDKHTFYSFTPLEEAKAILTALKLMREYIKDEKDDEEFPDRDRYRKKEYDMQLLTKIDYKVQKGFELTKEELRLLYEIDNNIEEFGYEKDSRIEQIINKRNIKRDLAYIFDCKEEEICLGGDLPKDKTIKVYWGSLDLRNLTNANRVTLPEYIRGSLNLGNLTSVEGVTLPEYIRGSLNLGNLTSVEGVRFPKYIGGTLNLRNLTNANRVTLPEYIGGSLHSRKLTSANGVTFPKCIGGSLYLDNLTSAKGLIFPKYIGEDLWLCHLASVEGVTLPEYIGGSIDLNNLTSAEGLKLPSNFNIYNQLSAPYHIIMEILIHPEKYYNQKEKKETESVAR